MFSHWRLLYYSSSTIAGTTRLLSSLQLSYQDCFMSMSFMLLYVSYCRCCCSCSGPSDVSFIAVSFTQSLIIVFHLFIFFIHLFILAVLYIVRPSQESKFWNYFLHFGLHFGVSIMVFCYTTEFYARMFCPREETFIDVFIPRFYECFSKLLV